MTVRAVALSGLVVLALVAAACGDGGDEALPSDTRAPVVDPTEPSTVAPPTTIETPAPVRSVAGVEIGLETVATLDQPIALASRPGVDDLVYVAERPGVVVTLDLSDGSTTEVVDISDEVSTDSERGLLALAFAPDGERLYLSWTNLDGDTRIAEYRVNDDGAVDGDSRRAVFALDQPFPNHNGGDIAFGPDGMLYLGLGDGGSGGDPLQAGQDRGQLLGSILRIDPAGVDGSAYAVPADNPFLEEEGDRPEVWLKGVRNPWRFSFDRATGDLWVGDVGQDEVEEIDRLPAAADGTGAGRGANLGWNAMEGDRPYEDGVEPEDHTPPVFAYDHADGGCSVIGGYRYRGSALPELAGAYVFSDFCLGTVQALAVPDDEVLDEVLDHAVISDPVPSPASFGEGPDGELYLLSLEGDVLKLVPAP